MAVSTTALKAKTAPKPKQWVWEAKNRSGETKKGEMEALDAGAVDTRLKALGLAINYSLVGIERHFSRWRA